MKKLLSVLGNILLVIVILLAVVMTFASLNTNEKGLPEIGGYMIMNIQSDSMEPAIMTGDLIVTKAVENTKDLKKGDVISFISKVGSEVVIITHRIESVNDNYGEKTFTTKGDNTPAVDEDEVLPVAVISKYEGTRIPVLGAIFSFLSGRLGFFIFIILPLFVLFIYQIYKFIATIMEEKKKELIQKIREEQRKESQAN